VGRMVGGASTAERRRLIYGEQARQLDLESYLHLIAVLGLGAATLWGAIPIGLAMGLEPWVAGFAAAMGAALGTLAVLALGGRIRNYPPALLAKAANRRRGVTYRIWVRYGVAGLGLSAPLFVGAPLGAALGIILGAPVDRLLIWMMLGIVLWSAGLTLVATLGLSAFQQ